MEKTIAPSTPTTVVYHQDFEDESVGESPRNWGGEYNYASLMVTDDNPAPSSAKCMRFEKSSGSGSAYYSCAFPDATGKVGVKFDLRCDDKNKYLLGFYVEMDEDFRQSIHTIIHKTEGSPTPSIRIHGEPVPYEFGTWVSIQYEIDLNEGVLDGYIDGRLVAEKVRMAVPPKTLNTLSIRDNLATTGILAVDNIQIYQM